LSAWTSCARRETRRAGLRLRWNPDLGQESYGIADKGLSSYAHNVKVITRDGKVTLRGPVRSSGEKKTVELKAAEVAGAGNVINRLSVAVRTSTSKKAGA
jgi:BON domain